MFLVFSLFVLIRFSVRAAWSDNVPATVRVLAQLPSSERIVAQVHESPSSQYDKLAKEERQGSVPSVSLAKRQDPSPTLLSDNEHEVLFNAAANAIGLPGIDATPSQNYRYADRAAGGHRALAVGGNNFSQLDATQLLVDRGLNYGLGLANAAAEDVFMGLNQTPYGGARARFNFMLDRDGQVNGEGDFLLPLWDSKYTTVYTQLGARSMNTEESGNRWIGNLGVGQRWYPLAENSGIGGDAGNLMLGYNIFYDYDFTRNHSRAGVGIEGQYDWLHLASNYYAPVSNWKVSKDFNGYAVQERAVEGWDIRAKGYLPFYRNVAVTGAYSQWFGDNVGLSGVRRLENDPKVWSYGVEYTPVPLLSGFMQQRIAEGGKTETEVGLRVTYNFGMSWKEQTSHRKVAELRTVGGSRHEFVDRENRIILEYKAKNKFYVELVDKVGINLFKFRLLDGFGKIVPAKKVRVSADGGVVLAEANIAEPTTLFAHAGKVLGDIFSMKTAHAADFFQVYTTDTNGEFLVRLDNVVVVPVVLTFLVDNTTQRISLLTAARTGEVISVPSTLTNGANATLTFRGRANTAVDWVITSGPGSISSAQNITDGTGKATAILTANPAGYQDIVVVARVNGADYSVTVPLTATYDIIALTVTGGTGNFTAATTATFTASVLRNGVPAPPGINVTWSVTAANNSANPAVTSDYQNKKTGLAWGASAPGQPGSELNTSTVSATNGSGDAQMKLTDIVGERTVTVKASVGDGTATRTQSVTYGTGPLGAFRLAADGTTGQYTWADAIPLSTATNFPAATACGGTVNPGWGPGDYSGATFLPSIATFRTVSGSTGNNSYKAAGWRDDNGVDGFWSATLNTSDDGTVVGVVNGRTFVRPLNSQRRVVCLR